MNLTLPISLGLLLLLQADMPDFQMHSSPINAPAPGNLEGYMIGAFAAACTTLFSLVLWLLRVIFREKEKALEREVDRSNRLREDNNSNETNLKEVLLNINNTLTRLKEVLEDLKETDDKVLDKLGSVEQKMSEGFLKINQK